MNEFGWALIYLKFEVFKFESHSILTIISKTMTALNLQRRIIFTSRGKTSGVTVPS